MKLQPELSETAYTWPSHRPSARATARPKASTSRNGRRGSPEDGSSVGLSITAQKEATTSSGGGTGGKAGCGGGDGGDGGAGGAGGGAGGGDGGDGGDGGMLSTAQNSQPLLGA